MNAKELRAAAEVAVMQWDNHDRHRLVAGDDVLLNSHGEPNEVTFARHILATVRDDDDEPVTYERLAAFGPKVRDDEMGGVELSFGCLEIYGARDNECLWIASSKDSNAMLDMGQFRSLCRGLGIELKEIDRAE